MCGCVCVWRGTGEGEGGGEGGQGREDRRVVVVVRTYDLTDEFLLTRQRMRQIKEPCPSGHDLPRPCTCVQSPPNNTRTLAHVMSS